MSDTPRKIVVVEDDPQIRLLVEKVLVMGGFQVASTGDPTQAAELVRREDPALVLCDIAMPVMDGYGVIKELQADPQTAKYPVVFLTAHREFSERVRAFRYGVVDYLTKPFSREILLRKIERVLEGLENRSGVVAEEAGGTTARQLLEEVQRQSRTGVLTLEQPQGTSRVLLRAGEIVQTTGDLAPDFAARAEFQELQAGLEDIAVQDPPSLPGSDQPLPLFEDLPEGLRDVLVVDDNAVFRRFLRDLLTLQGFRVYDAGSAEEGLRMALEKPPWLILTDVYMPGGADGFEFCRQVRTHSLLRQTPLLFLSGWDDYTQRYRGLELGADDFISKTTPVRELLMRIRVLLKRYADMGARASARAQMGGQIQLIGAPALLQMFHLSRVSGMLTAEDGSRRATIHFRDGEVVGADTDGMAGVEAFFEFLAWERGTFQFLPGEPGASVRLGQSFDQILLEGCRILDEKRRLKAEPSH